MTNSHTYAYNESDNSFHYVAATAAKEMKISDSSTHSKLDQIVTNTGSGGDASSANQVIGNASLSSIDTKIVNCNTSAVVVSSGVVTETNSSTINSTLSSISSTQATESTLFNLDSKVNVCDTSAVVVSSGSVTETNSGSIDSTLTSLNSKVTTCDTSAVVVSSSALPTGASTELKQDDIVTKLNELNDSNNSEESFTASALSFNSGISHNTNNYSTYSFLVNSTADDTTVLIQASSDNTNWYHADYPTSVNFQYDADNSSDLQYNYASYGAHPVAKYIRVRVYTPTAATVKVIFNMLH